MLFVSSDNDTGELDVPHIESIVGKRHAGFTMWRASGHWKGNTEDTAVILVSDTPDSVAETIEALKSELHQDAIGVQPMPAMSYA
jgi:hypothetical protein